MKILKPLLIIIATMSNLAIKAEPKLSLQQIEDQITSMQASLNWIDNEITKKKAALQKENTNKQQLIDMANYQTTPSSQRTWQKASDDNIAKINQLGNDITALNQDFQTYNSQLHQLEQQRMDAQRQQRMDQEAGREKWMSSDMPNQGYSHN